LIRRNDTATGFREDLESKNLLLKAAAMRAEANILIFLLTLSLLPSACVGYKGKASGPAADSSLNSCGKGPAGDYPAANNPGYADLPPISGQLSYQDRLAWRKILNWSRECEDAFDATMSKEHAGLLFHELSDRKYLVEITCTLGAYQGFQNYAYLDLRGDWPVARILSFPAYESEKEGELKKKETAELWGLSGFDPKTKHLIILNRFRGTGDCGTLATYGFHDGFPELVELRADLKCDGNGERDPQRWKRISPP